ncbi:MAG: flagellar biosynthetic protein FliR [Planctomyces sp.]|jgi:flagellar biosynthesis protein FliR
MIESLAIASALILFRVAAFVAFLPPMGGVGMPATVKIGLSIALTVMLAPLHAGTAAQTLATGSGNLATWIWLAFLSGRETILGISMAWMFGLCLTPVRTAGAWISQEMGLTMGGLTSPMDAQPSNVFSQFLEAIGVMMFFTMNMHHIVFFSFGQTFIARPVGSGWLLPNWDAFVKAVSLSIDQGLVVIAPIGILLFVTVLMLLITIRAAPQFNFMSYGMTLRLMAGMIAVVLFLPEICGAIQMILYQVGSGGGF